MNNENTGWLSAYIFHPEPLDKVLTDAVFPFLQKETAEQFFFIRYWEKGDHIRLRVLCPDPLRYATVKEKMIRHFGSWLENEKKIQPADDKVFELQFVAYDPETERYGGVAGLPVCEKNFYHSSVAALGVMQEYGAQWSITTACAAAIQMHLAFIFSIGKKTDEAIEYFHSVHHDWLFSLTEDEAHRQRYLDQYESLYALQKQSLVPFIAATWELIENDEESGEQWFDEWRNAIQLDSAALIQEMKSEKVVGRIGKSLMHMTNNRLGITNFDEGYIAWLLAVSMKEIQAENVQ